MLNVARIFVLVGALCMVALGFLVGGLGFVMIFVDPAADPLTTATMSGSFVALTVGLGLALALQARRSIQEQSSSPFRPGRLGFYIITFLMIVLFGQAALALDVLPALVFPPFHIAAAILPALIVLAAVGRGLGPVTRWREIILQVSSGALLSTLLAFSLEFAIFVSFISLAFFGLAVQPGGLELVKSALTCLQDPAWMQDPANLAFVVKSPVFLAAVFLAIAGIIPVVEELVKTVGVGLMAIYRRPTLAQAFLWGVAGGAGFALAEGLFNSLGGLDVWAAVVLLRVGATMLHTFTGGLVGLAWHSVLAERRWLRAFGFFAISVAVHGLWNALAAGMTLASLSTMDGDMTDIGQGLVGLGVFAMLALLLFLALLMILGLFGLAHYVKRRMPPVQTMEPTATSTPVLAPSEAIGNGGFEFSEDE